MTPADSLSSGEVCAAPAKRAVPHNSTVPAYDRPSANNLSLIVRRRRHALAAGFLPRV